MYVMAGCPYCVRAEQLLKQKQVIEIDKIRVDIEPEQKREMIEKTGRRTVPQIFIGDVHVGGCDDLHALEDAGELDTLLQG
ncbi:MAG: glutaredoxin 3 [Methylophilaceae bacterium]|nr:glutaredoxin 3 [Methylophilaceae bacterium]